MFISHAKNPAKGINPDQHKIYIFLAKENILSILSLVEQNLWPQSFLLVIKNCAVFDKEAVQYLLWRLEILPSELSDTDLA